MNKRIHYGAARGVLPILAAALLVMGCPDPEPEPGSDGSRTVEAKYMFYSRNNWSEFNPVSGSTTSVSGSWAKLDENSFTITVEGRAPITFTGVYTAGGGTHRYMGGMAAGPWSYLYNASGKIGIIFICVKQYHESFIMLFLGKSVFRGNMFVEFDISPADIADMQDAIIGEVSVEQFTP
ncbi:MAG: hypothetical protein LBD20_03875 [Spirochaetaceae bacterium]|jgi:hypothetical protein|nr:hypothetical protein [Spirochaetaceae bacterium]